jgi:hypothetical protein
MTIEQSKSHSLFRGQNAQAPVHVAAASVSWYGRTREALQRLGERPPLLFAVLWAVSAIYSPYARWAHDSKLYGILVLNRISSGAFADDLFLRFGSQDDYAPFSRLAAPLARLLGVDWTFFLLFLVFDALFIYALQRLVRALVADRVLSTLALLVMVIAPLPYGGLKVFHVHEPFFTPRIAACAIGFLALEQVLRQRYVGALALSVVSTLAHPLMGFGVFLITGGCAALNVVSRRDIWWLTSLGGAAVGVLAYRPLGARVFGVMDAEWLEFVRRATPYNFPTAWTAADWANAAISLGAATTAGLWMMRESPQRARFLLLTASVGIVGVAVSGVAAYGSYRILLQGQPYRAVWLAVALQTPVALWLAVRVWRKGGHARLLAVAIVATLTIRDLLTLQVVALQVVVLFIAFPFFLVAQRGLRSVPRRGDWLVRSLAGSLVVGAIGWGVMRVIVAGLKASDFLEVLDPIGYARVVVYAFGTVFWLAVVLASLCALLGRHAATSSRLVHGALAVVMLVHAAAFLLPRVPWYRHSGAPHGRDVQFVQTYLATRALASGTVPTIYAGAWGNVEYPWFHLHAKSYFDLAQVVGVIFSRETAMEAGRRADIVRSFELDRYHATRPPVPELTDRMMRQLFRPEVGAAPPTRADVGRLCQSGGGVDVAILRQDFSGLSSVSNGRVAVYDCARVRTARARGGIQGDS